jgi:Flp pilus assembly protein TadG
MHTGDRRRLRLSGWLPRIRRRHAREDGQALVELAFVLPIVMLILFGIIDFGLALNNYNADTNLANLAARAASVMGTTSTISCSGTTENSLKSFVTCEAAATGAPTPTYVCFADTANGLSATLTAGDPLKVEVQSTFGWLKLLTGGNGYVGGIHLNSTITASATNRIEAAPASGTSNSFFSTTTTPLCTS